MMGYGVRRTACGAGSWEWGAGIVRSHGLLGNRIPLAEAGWLKDRSPVCVVHSFGGSWVCMVEAGRWRRSTVCLYLPPALALPAALPGDPRDPRQYVV